MNETNDSTNSYTQSKSNVPPQMHSQSQDIRTQSALQFASFGSATTESQNSSQRYDDMLGNSRHAELQNAIVSIRKQVSAVANAVNGVQSMQTADKDCLDKLSVTLNDLHAIQGQQNNILFELLAATRSLGEHLGGMKEEFRQHRHHMQEPQQLHQQVQQNTFYYNQQQQPQPAAPVLNNVGEYDECASQSSSSSISMDDDDGDDDDDEEEEEVSVDGISVSNYLTAKQRVCPTPPPPQQTQLQFHQQQQQQHNRMQLQAQAPYLKPITGGRSKPTAPAAKLPIAPTVAAPVQLALQHTPAPAGSNFFGVVVELDIKENI